MPGSWRCDESKLPAASFTFDGGTHWIRPLRMWFGEVERVTGLMGSAVHHMAVSICAFVCPVPCLLAPLTCALQKRLIVLECNPICGLMHDPVPALAVAPCLSLALTLTLRPHSLCRRRVRPCRNTSSNSPPARGRSSSRSSRRPPSRSSHSSASKAARGRLSSTALAAARGKPPGPHVYHTT